ALGITAIALRPKDQPPILKPKKPIIPMQPEAAQEIEIIKPAKPVEPMKLPIVAEGVEEVIEKKEEELKKVAADIREAKKEIELEITPDKATEYYRTVSKAAELVEQVKDVEELTIRKEVLATEIVKGMPEIEFDVDRIEDLPSDEDIAKELNYMKEEGFFGIRDDKLSTVLNILELGLTDVANNIVPFTRTYATAP
ncbi:MAG: hypothetical protein ACK4NC_07560, partial [Candidatus Gracilibacteria bacterium]